MMRDPYVHRQQNPPVLESMEIVVALVLMAVCWFTWYVARERFFFTNRQIAELACYLALGGLAIVGSTILIATARSRREKQWPHPPMVISRKLDERLTAEAWRQDAVVLGYDIHGEPWYWPDRVRVMQGILLGMTGSGKTTLLKNIITQDMARVAGTPKDPHRLPMVIFDGKGDLEFFYDLLPHVHRAGRLHQLRVLNPARPDISVRYNPFYCGDDDYMSVVNMVFGSFNLHDEFFAKHQLNYLADIVRVLVHTGQKFNFYDVLVMAIDEQVLREQVEKARHRLEHDPSIPVQRRLNFEMSVKNLYQSFGDRERVPKIQGLVNECMTFLDDELSVITGPYEELLSLDEVIEQELILFVTLNVNKNTEPVRALGKMLLQNLQLVVGKRYESEEQRRRTNRPMFSVVLDEFAPFGYRNFAQILQTARGTHTAFLFSMQSLPQLMQVGRGFKEDVTSAPNTTLTMRTRDEETARYFLRASAEHTVTRRSVSMHRWRMFGYEKYEATDRATESEDRETRALDEHIKNLPKGQMEILMTDDTRGTLHQLLHVRPPQDVRIPNFEPELYARTRQSREQSTGANLRFKTPELVATKRFARWIRRVDSPMKRTFAAFVLAVVGLMPVGSATAQQERQSQRASLGPQQVRPDARPRTQSASPIYQRGDTWYEFLLRQFNPNNVDYGTWMEERRQVFLDESARSPYFKYSLGTTIALLVFAMLYTKQWIDHRRAMWVTAEMMTDLYNHDAYSRGVAREAIQKYNDHIERCNRAIESADHGTSIPGADSDANHLKSELVSVADERDSYKRERDLAKRDLLEKEKLIADMSVRLDAMVRKTDANHVVAGPVDMSAADPKVVQLINNLQEQLYAERRENRRLKGA